MQFNASWVIISTGINIILLKSMRLELDSFFTKNFFVLLLASYE